MNWNEIFNILNYRLAQLYRHKNDALRVTKLAGYNTLLIDYDGPPMIMWFNILEYARIAASNNKKIIDLLNFITSPQELGADDEVLLGIRENLISGTSPVEQPKFINQPISTSKVEKIMQGNSTLLPINFLEKGLICSKAVVRIVTPKGLGTGFLVGNNYIITNNHVIDSVKVAKETVVQFNYQKTLEGVDSIVDEFRLDAEDEKKNFISNEELDYTIVKIKGDPAQKYGSLSFSKTSIEKEDFVNIIQHPAGGPKQIALYHNVVTFTNENIVQYLTDTLPGSSGSPVFNSNWEVVALHHAGGNLIDPDSNQIVFRNEGINALRIQEALKLLIS